MRLEILKNKMLRLRYENELCQRYLLLKLMPTLAIHGCPRLVKIEAKLPGCRKNKRTLLIEDCHWL